MLRTLELDTIGDLGEGADRLIIDAAIRAAVHDIDDLGTDGKPREVIIKIKMQRLDGGRGHVAIHCTAKANLPEYVAPATVAKVLVKDGISHLSFQDGDAKDPTQRTIDEVVEQ